MRVSLMIEGQQGVTWDQWLALARACEENGIERLFRSDHYLGFHARGPDGSLDCWATLAGLAAVTSKLRLGSLVSPGAGRRGTLVPAVRWADEYNTTFPTDDEVVERRRRLLEECERQGREPLRFSLMAMASETKLVLTKKFVIVAASRGTNAWRSSLSGSPIKRAPT